jgi:plastocyanin
VRSAVILAALGLAAPALAGTINGKVELVEKGGRKAGDLSDVVVYVDGLKARPKPGKATLTMKGKTFIPHVIVVGVGGSVEFPNEDPILHNAFSVSGENRFDLGLYKKPKTASWTFQAPGVARVYCNIHPQMSAIVVVRDNPYFTKTAADGSFSLEGVPAGKYALTAWHERASEATIEVNVPAEGAVGAQLVLDGSAFKRVQHKNKFGKDYSSDEPY